MFLFDCRARQGSYRQHFKLSLVLSPGLGVKCSGLLGLKRGFKGRLKTVFGFRNGMQHDLFDYAAGSSISDPNPNDSFRQRVS